MEGWVLYKGEGVLVLEVNDKKIRFNKIDLARCYTVSGYCLY